VGVCSFWYAACNAHASYYHQWPVRLYNIFPHYLILGLKMSTSDFSWGKGGRCLRLMTYHPCSAECQVFRGHKLPGPLGPSRRPVVGDLYLYLLSHTRRDFGGGKKFTEHKMCVLISSTTFVSNITRSSKKRARYDKKCTRIFM
jgi:hypothetical protein